MITYITFVMVTAVSIALIAMGLIEIDAEKKREITSNVLSDKPITIKELQDCLGAELNYDSPNVEVTVPDGTIIRVGGVYIEGEPNE